MITITRQYVDVIHKANNASFHALAAGLLFLATGMNTASAQSASTEEMAKQLANPIGALISVPFQYNYDSGHGSSDGNASTLNIQPVVPISIGDDWNLISRTILPVKSQNDVFGDSGHQSGIGDTLQSFWFSPKAPTADGLIWGLGAAFYVPTSSDPLLGVGEWGGGPTVVGLKQSGPWTYGGLANHIWTFDDDSINATFLQPFVSYTTPEAWTFSINAEATYDWNSEEWSAPLNGNVSKIVRFGDQMVSLTAGAGYYVDSATGGPDGWRGRLVMTFLFPK